MKFTKVFFSVLVMLRTNYIHRDVKRLFRQSLLAKELLRESSHKEELAIKVPFLKTELKLLSTLCTDNSFKKGDIFVVCRMWFLFFRVKSIFIDTRTFALCQRWSWKCSKNFWELGNIFDFIFELKRLNWNLKTRSKQRKKERKISGFSSRDTLLAARAAQAGVGWLSQDPGKAISSLELAAKWSFRYED